MTRPVRPEFQRPMTAAEIDAAMAKQPPMRTVNAEKPWAFNSYGRVLRPEYKRRRWTKDELEHALAEQEQREKEGLLVAEYEDKVYTDDE